MKHGPVAGYSGHYGRIVDGWVEVALGKGLVEFYKAKRKLGS